LTERELCQCIAFGIILSFYLLFAIYDDSSILECQRIRLTFVQESAMMMFDAQAL
jgi:hypothetical protein